MTPQHPPIALLRNVSVRRLAGKIVADFGCGPQGSLCWAGSARLRIGIDILANSYMEFGIASHDVCYVCSTEKRIPLPSGYVDVLYTMNALDHVADLDSICAELLRILAPGGVLIGSFNLGEPPSITEPQTLTEDALQAGLFRHLDVVSYRVAAPGSQDQVYRHFFDGSSPPESGVRFLWVRARKPPSAAILERSRV